jgi:hypothetical protein
MLAFTLIEMLTLMVLLTMAVGAATAVLFAGFKVQSTDLAALDQLLILGAVADRFRADVRNAQSAELAPERDRAKKLTVARAAAGTVAYAAEPGWLVRTERAGRSETVQRLRLGRDCRAEFRTHPENPRVVVLSVFQRRQGRGEAEGEAVILEVHAALRSELR